MKIANLDRLAPANLAYDTGYGVGMTAAVERRTGVVQIDAFQFGRKPVRITFAADFAIGDDVESGPFLVEDRQTRGIVLCLQKPLRIDAPQLAGAHARRETLGQFRPVEQPIGLGIGSDKARRQYR